MLAMSVSAETSLCRALEIDLESFPDNKFRAKAHPQEIGRLVVREQG